MTVNSMCWMVGGPQGSGVDSAARLFALATARAGLNVVGQREYYSNIKGEHSYYKIRVCDTPIRSPVKDVQLLATYDEETLVRHLHANEVVAGGAVLYDPETLGTEIEEIGTLDRRVKDDVAKVLDAKGLPHTVNGVLELARSQGAKPVALPYKELMEKVGQQVGVTDFGRLLILKNTMAVGASFGLLGLEADVLDDTIRATFEGKSPKLIDMNILAAKLAADKASETLASFGYSLRKRGGAGERLWLQGTNAVALGKIAAGCRFQTYYPISPATDESVFLEANPDSGTVVVQCEDEIGAAVMAIGAALTGARASTSTSGPGFCLMVEAMGWAGICEVPLVIVDYQRGGPSTGLPTRTEQGDLAFALKLGHGEFPRIVFAPGDIEEMFHYTVEAFNWAEKYQTPVIFLPDKDLAGNSMTLDPFKLDGLQIQRGKLASAEHLAANNLEGRFLRFKLTEDGISPRSFIGQKDGIHWLTGDEHVEIGHITEDPVVREKMMEKRMGKLALVAREIPSQDKLALHGPAHADVTIVSWGGTKGPILDALPELEKRGIKANFLQIRLLSPFPDDDVARLLKDAKKVLCLEQNYSGQLADLVRERTGIKIPHRVVKYNGRPVTLDEVVEAVEVVVKKGEERVVLRHGV